MSAADAGRRQPRDDGRPVQRAGWACLRQRSGGNAEQVQQFRVPCVGVQVAVGCERHRQVAGMDRAAGQIPEQPAIHGAQAKLAANVCERIRRERAPTASAPCWRKTSAYGQAGALAQRGFQTAGVRSAQNGAPRVSALPDHARPKRLAVSAFP